MQLNTLIQKTIEGNRQALARLITLLETDKDTAIQILRLLPKSNEKSFIVGITGAPGVGKSTFIGKLAQKLAEKNLKVGILANDPSSPFSGGAILGNRLRMDKALSNDNIFIRSITTRGAIGGISWLTDMILKVFEIAGYSTILIETVGSGQTDLEISRIADLILIVTMPELGDEIQALKAGLLELADAVILNKCDLPAAQSSYTKLRLTLPKEIPIFKVSALNDQGILEVTEYLLQKKNDPNFSQRDRKRKRIKDALLRLTINKILESDIIAQNDLGNYVNAILEREITIEQASWELAEKILKKIFGQ